MAEDKRLFFKLNKAQRLLLNYFDHEATDLLGVSITQIATLFYLRSNDGCLLKDLSIELSQNKSAITTLIERMGKNGLIQKVASEKDGRASHIFLTEKGRTVSEQALPIVKENNKKLTDQFTTEEIEIINRFFDRIIEIYK